ERDNERRPRNNRCFRARGDRQSCHALSEDKKQSCAAAAAARTGRDGTRAVARRCWLPVAAGNRWLSTWLCRDRFGLHVSACNGDKRPSQEENSSQRRGDGARFHCHGCQWPGISIVGSSRSARSNEILSWLLVPVLRRRARAAQPLRERL